MDSDWNCVYYDDELKELDSAVKVLSSVFKRIHKRAERRQTQQLSKSVFDYWERRTYSDKMPQFFYDFRYDPFRVCVYRKSGNLFVLVVGDLDWSALNFPVFEVLDDGSRLFGPCLDMEDAALTYLEIVYHVSAFIYDRRPRR